MTTKPTLRLIIAGGRDYRLTGADLARLDALAPRVVEVVTGRARGADTDGEAWAKARGIPVQPFPADWKRFGRSAGPIRNREMAKYANAVALFPGNRGTNDMADAARESGLEIFDWRQITGQQQELSLE